MRKPALQIATHHSDHPSYLLWYLTIGMFGCWGWLLYMVLWALR